MKILTNFAVFEGGDGSGTTTQLELLKRRLSPENGGPVFFPTCEPTGGPIGRLIRQALGRDLRFEQETIARLFAADRAEHLYAPGGIVERAERGELVISDRYVPSSLVYQGLACGGELPRILNEDFPAPELVLFFDIEPESALERMKNRTKLEIYEYLEFQIEVRKRYRDVLSSFSGGGSEVAIIDASPPPDRVAEEVWSILSRMPILKA
jgi:dTMP kinase